MDNKELLNELIEWAKLKGIEIDERDTSILKDIISFAFNNGYQYGYEVIKKSLKGGDE